MWKTQLRPRSKILLPRLERPNYLEVLDCMPKIIYLEISRMPNEFEKWLKNLPEFKIPNYSLEHLKGLKFPPAIRADDEIMKKRHGIPNEKPIR